MELILLEYRASATDVTLKAQNKGAGLHDQIGTLRRTQIRKLRKSVTEKKYVYVQIHNSLITMDRHLLFLWSLLWISNT